MKNLFIFSLLAMMLVSTTACTTNSSDSDTATLSTDEKAALRNLQDTELPQ